MMKLAFHRSCRKRIQERELADKGDHSTSPTSNSLFSGNVLSKYYLPHVLRTKTRCEEDSVT
eukprot:3056956-Amphidinium_carterae.1